MTRVIAGSAGGRRLRTPAGDATRPTSDRVREAVFSALEHELGTLSGRRFLDLYAGSGAVGLEARSRGASAVVLVEKDARVSRVARGNAADLGLGGVDVVTAAVERYLRAGPAGEPYDVVFLDPPYPMATERVVDLLALLRRGGWTREATLAVVERSARTPDLTWPEGWEPVRSRRYGETCVWYGRATERDAGHPGTEPG